MPRGRPKGSKNKSSSSRKGMAATPTQLASLAKARKVRAKQIKYFPALPEGGFKALSTPARLSAIKSAYAKFSKKKMASAKPRKLRVSSVSPTTIVVSSVPQTRKTPFNRASKAKRSAMISALTGTLNYKKPIGPRRRATETQLAALAKARAARASKRSGSMLYLSAPPILSRAELMV